MTNVDFIILDANVNDPAIPQLSCSNDFDDVYIPQVANN